MKKRKLFLCLFVLILLSKVQLNAQVSIGGNSSQPQPPQPFSILELISGQDVVNIGGLRLPQLTEANKTAINSELLNNDKSAGLFIYNSDKSCIEFWNGTAWVAPGSSPVLPWQIAGPDGSRSTATASITDSIFHTGAVNIGSTTGDPSAVLNVQSSNQGVLMPRVTLANATDVTTITNPTTGLLVYNTGANPAFPTVGYMFWDGAEWRIFANASAEPASATMECENPAMNPSQQVTGGTALITGTLLQIPYSMSNGGNYAGVTLTSVGNSNVTATIGAGTLAQGSGVLNFSLSGTPTINQQAPNGIVFDLTPFPVMFGRLIICLTLSFSL